MSLLVAQSRSQGAQTLSTKACANLERWPCRHALASAERKPQIQSPRPHSDNRVLTAIHLHGDSHRDDLESSLSSTIVNIRDLGVLASVHAPGRN
jgi:hypothetical protein